MAISSHSASSHSDHLFDPDVDPKAVVLDWFSKFTSAIGRKDVPAIVDLCLDDCYWRDTLSLTWDFHTFRGRNAVSTFLEDQLGVFNPQQETFVLQKQDFVPHQPSKDSGCIPAFFSFDTNVGHASGIFRLVPLPDGVWKAHTIYTNLEELTGFPEQIGPLRDHQPNHGKWAAKREREIKFLDEDPTVIIVGGGHCGLAVAARLKMLGVSVLVIERNTRIGDNWRNRYGALCLHDPVWYDHLAYLPFPVSWPVYTPALKLADWLESYANSLELNVWTSATVTSIEKEIGEPGKRWSVQVGQADGRKRTFKVGHVVMALGTGSGRAKIPDIPGQDTYNGHILHSSTYKHATDHSGKKVAVIGACTSAHDICSDLVEHDIGKSHPSPPTTTDEAFTRSVVPSAQSS